MGDIPPELFAVPPIKPYFKRNSKHKLSEKPLHVLNPHFGVITNHFDILKLLHYGYPILYSFLLFQHADIVSNKLKLRVTVVIPTLKAFWVLFSSMILQKITFLRLNVCVRAWRQRVALNSQWWFANNRVVNIPEYEILGSDRSFLNLVINDLQLVIQLVIIILCICYLLDYVRELTVRNLTSRIFEVWVFYSCSHFFLLEIYLNSTSCTFYWSQFHKNWVLKFLFLQEFFRVIAKLNFQSIQFGEFFFCNFLAVIDFTRILTVHWKI